MSIFASFISRNWHPGRAAVVGAIATAAYSIAMEGDMSITGNHFSDVKFIQGLMGKKATKEQRFLVLAWLLHFLNGIALSEIYAALAKRFLPGPGWLKGAIFGELFVASVWPLTPLADKYHPLIKDGTLPKLANFTSLAQNLGRHLVFGLALGLLYRD
jgi:hypothetical protein